MKAVGAIAAGLLSFLTVIVWFLLYDWQDLPWFVYGLLVAALGDVLLLFALVFILIGVICWLLWRIANVMNKYLVLIPFLFALGCAQMFSSKTMVTVENAGCKASYESDKEQLGLESEICGGKLKVGRSGTQEQVIAATLAAQMQMLDLLRTLTGLANRATVP